MEEEVNRWQNGSSAAEAEVMRARGVCVYLCVCGRDRQSEARWFEGLLMERGPKEKKRAIFVYYTYRYIKRRMKADCGHIFVPSPLVM